MDRSLRHKPVKHFECSMSRTAPYKCSPFTISICNANYLHCPNRLHQCMFLYHLSLSPFMCARLLLFCVCVFVCLCLCVSLCVCVCVWVCGWWSVLVVVFVCWWCVCVCVDVWGCVCACACVCMCVCVC